MASKTVQSVFIEKSHHVKGLAIIAGLPTQLRVPLMDLMVGYYEDAVTFPVPDPEPRETTEATALHIVQAEEEPAAAEEDAAPQA